MSDADIQQTHDEFIPAADATYATGRTGVQLISVSVHSDGQRLDNFLLSRLRGLPKSHLYRLIRKGEIRINKKRCKPDTRVGEGDVVRVAPLRLSAETPMAIPGDRLLSLLADSVLYEDEELLIINKPSGLAVHAGTGSNVGVIEALRFAAAPGEFRELVHRLDKETSGCLMIAKSGLALKTLQEDLKQKRIRKTYSALVHGHWPAELTEVDVPLRKFQPHEGERIVRVDKNGKASVTRFRLLETWPDASLVEAQPLTGRTHQIRVHCQHAGHPIIGDDKYTLHKRHRFEHVRQLNLHASQLALQHPVTGKALKIAAPLRDGRFALE